jgi:hypothetical protein
MPKVKLLIGVEVTVTLSLYICDSDRLISLYTDGAEVSFVISLYTDGAEVSSVVLLYRGGAE